MPGKSTKKRSIAARKVVPKTLPRNAATGAFVVTDKRGRTVSVSRPSERSAAAIVSIARAHSKALKRLAQK